MRLVMEADRISTRMLLSADAGRGAASLSVLLVVVVL
jgi:hypothetical protein